MQKLGAIDANFLYSETDQVFNHIASVQHFCLPEDTHFDEFVEGLKTFLFNRQHLVPYLTNKVKFMPSGLDHPVWVKDSNFDINNHVIPIYVEAPGKQAQLEDTIAELHSKPMDRHKPLWCIYVLQGLENNQIAYYSQAHHACLDGMAGQAATQILMDTTPEHPHHSVPSEFLNTTESASNLELFSRSLEGLIKFQLEAGTRFLGNIDANIRLTQRVLDPSKSLGALGQSAPQTKFNKTIGLERTVAFGRLPLSDVKRIGKSLNCKINDVFMSICAGGLRQYLQAHNALPQRSLIAGCPVSLRPSSTSQSKNDMGNNVTMMCVDLATHLADPRVRTLKIKASAETAKAITADLAEAFNPEVSLPGLPIVAATGAFINEKLKLSNVLPSPLNLIISNVPGPRETLFSNGAEMLSHYPVSIPVHGAGLNITVQSYKDTLFFGITACKKAIPDARKLADALLSAYTELKQLATPQLVSENSNSPELVDSLEPINSPEIIDNTAPMTSKAA